MKKLSLFLLTPFLLVSCGSNNNISSFTSTNTEEDEMLNIIYSLRGRSHNVHFSQKVYVNQNDELAIDGFYGLEMDSTYSYDKNNNLERGYSMSAISSFADLEKGTKNIVTDDKGEQIISTYSQPKYTYFRDEETGAIVCEYLGIDNTIQSVYQSDYDQTNGIYTPVLFDDEFRNPFDYILPRDLTKINETTYRLDISKAAFALNCYNAISSAFVEDCRIIVDNGQIIKMEFDNKLDGGEGYTYSREISCEATFSNATDEALIKHIEVSKNKNDKLQQTFDILNTASSYFYVKEYVSRLGIETDRIEGYITEKASFYHHAIGSDENDYYKLGDDYDYAAVKNSVDNLYYGYEYTYSGSAWKFGPITLSSSAYYTIDNMLGLGPKFNQINASIFSLKEGTNNVYIIENELLALEIASYFDFQFLGVNSQVLESNTNHFELTLEDNGSFVVNTGYSYSDSGKTVSQNIKFTFDITSVNNASIPSFVELPNPKSLIMA